MRLPKARFALIALILLMALPIRAFSAEPPEVSSQNVILIDADTGKTLYGKGTPKGIRSENGLKHLVRNSTVLLRKNRRFRLTDASICDILNTTIKSDARDRPDDRPATCIARCQSLIDGCI